MINKGFGSFLAFEGVWNPNDHDCMIAFVRLPNRKWNVSIYTTHNLLDVSVIAKLFGGDGHKGAAGFQCDVLPFEW